MKPPFTYVYEDGNGPMTVHPVTVPVDGLPLTVNICTPHVATLPDGSTVNLPAGTVLREGEIGAARIGCEEARPPGICPGTGKIAVQDEPGLGRCPDCGSLFATRGRPGTPSHYRAS